MVGSTPRSWAAASAVADLDPGHTRWAKMNNRTLLIFSAVAGALVLAGGAMFIATFEVPRPTAQLERVIPDERFPR